METINYQDDLANTRDWLDNCVAISIGSIVEGFDVEITPQELAFPFSSTKLDSLIKAIDDEAIFYWDRDNSRFYKIHFNEDIFYLQETWGEYKWVTRIISLIKS